MSVYYLADRLAARTNSKTRSVARSRSAQSVSEGGCLLSLLRDKLSRGVRMAGMTVFPDLPSAVRAGYQVDDPHYEVRPGVFVVRVKTKTARGWAMAIALIPNRGDAA